MGAMKITVEAIEEVYPIAGKFSISRGSKTEARVVKVILSDGSRQGCGECVPYARYGETVEAVLEEIRQNGKAIADRPDRRLLQTMMKPGAAAMHWTAPCGTLKPRSSAFRSAIHWACAMRSP